MSDKPRIKAPTQSEAQLHKAVAQYLAKALRPPTIWTSIDAGQGKMTPRAAFQRKLRGVQPGWPDILVMHPGTPGQSMPVGIELKSKKGSLSEDQRAVQLSFKMAGANYAVCRSVADVADALRIGCVPLHASTFGAGKKRPVDLIK